MGYFEWPPYVPVAEKKKIVAAKIKTMIKRGDKISPITIEGKKIATSFWGKSWCEHLESFSDYENRLPRGRSYVRNGYVIHLAIKEGQIEALVQGSSLYKVNILIKESSKKKWASIITCCSGKIESVIELLQGKLSKAVMEIITDKENGLFPLPNEISLSCSCPDDAYMCKHVAAVLYGVGAKLDHEPELLFKLRQVDHTDLIAQATRLSVITNTTKQNKISKDSLESIFGIEIEDENKTDLNQKNKANINTNTSRKISTDKLIDKKVKTQKTKLANITSQKKAELNAAKFKLDSRKNKDKDKSKQASSRKKISKRAQLKK